MLTLECTSESERFEGGKFINVCLEKNVNYSSFYFALAQLSQEILWDMRFLPCAWDGPEGWSAIPSRGYRHSFARVPHCRRYDARVRGIPGTISWLEILDAERHIRSLPGTLKFPFNGRGSSLIPSCFQSLLQAKQHPAIAWTSPECFAKDGLRFLVLSSNQQGRAQGFPQWRDPGWWFVVNQ